MKQKRSPEEIKAYYTQMRTMWKTAKEKANVDEINAILYGLNLGGKVSAYSYYFVKQQMNAQGLDGHPYVDCQTFDRWRASGFTVRRGEHSKIDGITWIQKGGVDNEVDGPASDENGSRFCFPKVYHLFHRSQVEALQEVQNEMQ